VQRARHQFLAGAGLTQNADPRLACGYALRLRHHLAHGLAGPHDVLLADALAQLAILQLQALELERVFHGEQQLVGGERLLQEIDRPKPRGAHRHLDVRLAGHHHHRRAQAKRVVVLEEREPVFTGHHHVGEDEVEALRLDELERADGAVTHYRFVAGETEGARQRGQRVGVVVDDQQPRLLRRRLGLARHWLLAPLQCVASRSAVQCETWNHGPARSPP
jgi:hypothetical protein